MKKLTKISLGKKIHRLRDDVAMEQEVVARVLNIPRTSVAALEKGLRDVTAMELVELCKLFRLTPNDLLDWTSYQTRKSPQPAGAESEGK